jgi:hypothetical protein
LPSNERRNTFYLAKIGGINIQTHKLEGFMKYAVEMG